MYNARHINTFSTYMKKDQEKYLFVGERPSERAKLLGITWKDGGLAAKPLFEALRACGITPEEQYFLNLFQDHADVVNTKALRQIHEFQNTISYLTIVALGKKVEKHLLSYEIPHVYVTHPAARGIIRLRSNYIKHVREVLQK